MSFCLGLGACQHGMLGNESYEKIDDIGIRKRKG